MSKGRRKSVKISQNTYSIKSLFYNSYGVTQIIILCILYNANFVQCQSINFVSTYKKGGIIVYAQIRINSSICLKRNIYSDSQYRL